MLSPLWQKVPHDECISEELQQELGIHSVLCQLLAQRNIMTVAAAASFFKPKWNQLQDPFLMKDMDKAVERLDRALRQNEKILIYGDYDVDGTMSVSLLYQFLLNQGHTAVDFYLPDRYKEGYGISEAGMTYAYENDVSLLITVDCGIRAVAEVDSARRQGMDVIICDHHLPDKEWPFANAVLDPKRPDCDYPEKELSGCGVAFKLAQGLLHYRGKSDEELKELTDFLVISIACDVVPIIGENRIFSQIGLNQLNYTNTLGLRALLRVSTRKKPYSISDIVFGIGPIINASGRMADADLVVDLMLAGDKSLTIKYADQLKKRNELRKEYDRRTATEALEEVTDQEEWEKLKSLVLYQPHWHKGVIGIIAARFCVDFYRPTIILTKSDGVLVGSARSPGNVDLFAAIEKCKDLLLSYGGHTHAAGLSLKESNWKLFASRFEAAVAELITEESISTQPYIQIAAELKLEDITSDFYKNLRQFSPFGPSNRNPVFYSQQVEIVGTAELLKGEHIRFVLKQNDSTPIHAIAFGLGKYFEQFSKYQLFNICYSIEENHWAGKTKLQLMIKDFDFDGEKWEE